MRLGARITGFSFWLAGFELTLGFPCNDHRVVAVVVGSAFEKSSCSISRQKGSEQPQTAKKCGSVGNWPLTRPSATLSPRERGWGWGAAWPLTQIWPNC